MAVMYHFSNGNNIFEHKSDDGHFEYFGVNNSEGSLGEQLWSRKQGQIISKKYNAIALEVYDGFNRPATYLIDDNVIVTEISKDSLEEHFPPALKLS